MTRQRIKGPADDCRFFFIILKCSCYDIKAGRRGNTRGEREQKMEAVRRRTTKPINSGRILIRIILGMFLVFAVASAIAIYFDQEAQMVRINQKAATLSSEYDEANAELAELRELQNLADTDAYVERVARDQLGMVRPNEIIFDN